MLKSSKISCQMVCRKAMNTAMSVPRWSIREKKTPDSPLCPVKCWKRDRCPELDTGKNSVRPCKTACKNASMYDISKFSYYCYVATGAAPRKIRMFSVLCLALSPVQNGD